MWPNRRHGQSTIEEELQEVGRPFTSSTPEGSETGPVDEAFHGANAPVSLLLFSSLETYAAVQRTSTMRPPCDCTEELSVENYIRPSSPYPHLLYFPRPPHHSSTERSIVDSPPSRQIDDDNISGSNVVSDAHMSSNTTMNPTRSGESLSDAQFSPILQTKKSFSRLNKATVKRKLWPAPDPPLARGRLTTLPKMPRPSNDAKQMAIRIIKYARCIRNMHEKEMCCPNCGSLPMNPVTGQCGHTRCSNCLTVESKCPCGNDFSDSNANILIRDLVENTVSDGQSRISPVRSKVTTDETDIPNCITGDVIKVFSTDTSDGSEVQTGVTALGPETSINSTRSKSQLDSSLSPSSSGAFVNVKPRSRTRSRGNKKIPMTPRARYNYAMDLLRAGRHLDAAPHLALVAASDHTDFLQARKLLAGTMTLLSESRDIRSLTVELNREVRRLSATSWLRLCDMECVLCCDTFVNPVTTPCGHMFCRTCLERTLDYRRRCPLCLHSLMEFNLAETSNTMFVEGALKRINATVTPPPLEPDLIPIFVCTVAFPSVPCPLFIFDPRYWLMIRRVLESGSRKFGMVAGDRGQDYVDYGTVLEVRDCVHLEDGRSILSTVGLSRFKVIERGMRDGCEVARILPIIDVIPVENMEVWEIKVLGRQIILKAVLWLSRINSKVLSDIETAFGSLPLRGSTEDQWWDCTDGPAWLWWLVAVLPLRSEIKVLILSTDCLIKRMMAVARTLEAVDQVTTASTTHCDLPNSVSTDETMDSP